MYLRLKKVILTIKQSNPIHLLSPVQADTMR